MKEVGKPIFKLIKYTLMKQLVYGLLLIIIFGSCESDQERKKREAEENIYKTLTIQAKSSLSNISTYNFKSMKDYMINDSLYVYVHEFSGMDFSGVDKTNYAIGYFNINTGFEVDRSLLQFMASPGDLKRVSSIIGRYLSIE